MVRSNRLLLAGVLGLGLMLTTSCASTRAPGGGSARLEALAGMPAVTAALTEKAGRRVLIYHSPRCDFCRGVLHSATAALPELDPQAVIYTLDIDSNPEVRDAMNIGPVPVVVFLEDGVEVKRWRVYRPGFLVRSGLKSFFAP